MKKFLRREGVGIFDPFSIWYLGIFSVFGKVKIVLCQQDEKGTIENSKRTDKGESLFEMKDIGS